VFRSFRTILSGLAIIAGLVGAAPLALASDGGTLKVMAADASPDAIVMQWEGGIAKPMADQIRNAFEEHQGRAKRVVFRISSGGGSVAEGERVIRVLREIRRTHRLETVVDRGHRCGSMCVFIYLQGEHRVAALSSLWLFHEVSFHDPKTRQITRLDRPAWERLVDTYFGPAGVSHEWTERMKPLTVQSDYWQTGSDLANDRSGIFHAVLGNQRERLIAERAQPTPTPAPAPRIAERAPPRPVAAPATPKATPPETSQPMAISWETKACFELSAERGTYEKAPCRK
jgi:hypothetical protein